MRGIIEELQQQQFELLQTLQFFVYKDNLLKERFELRIRKIQSTSYLDRKIMKPNIMPK